MKSIEIKISMDVNMPNDWSENEGVKTMTEHLILTAIDASVFKNKKIEFNFIENNKTIDSTVLTMRN